MMDLITEIVNPLAIYLILLNVVTMLCQNWLDATLQTTLAAILALPVLWQFYQQDREKYQMKKQRIPAWVYPLAAMTGIVSNQILSCLLNFFMVTERFSNAAQENLLSAGIAGQLIGLGIVVPVAEELLFRGLIYQRLKRRYSVRTAILLGAGLFALFHGNMVQILFAFPMGVLILLCYEKWESLEVPIMFHISVNLSTVIITQIRGIY